MRTLPRRERRGYAKTKTEPIKPVLKDIYLSFFYGTKIGERYGWVVSIDTTLENPRGCISVPTFMKIGYMFLTVLLSFTSVINCQSPQTSKLRLTYVGNEGVLISDGAKAVLIDGLHRKYDDDYLNPPPEVLSAMEKASPPFDQVRIVLVSHVHGDHFSAESVGLHLKNNPKATFVSSAQKMADIARLFPDHVSVRNQMVEITPEWKQRAVFEKDGIKVTLLGMKHGSDRFWWIKNLGHIIEIGGKKVFHFGDADTAVENFAAFKLPAEKIDIAFIPYWFLLSENGRKLVRENIAAKTNIAVHISPQTADADAARLKQLVPGVDAFTKMSEERSF